MNVCKVSAECPECALPQPKPIQKQKPRQCKNTDRVDNKQPLMTTMFKKKTETTKKQQDEDRNEDTKEDTTKNWEKENKVKIEKDDNINVDQRLLLIPTLKISMNANLMKKRASRDNN